MIELELPYPPTVNHYWRHTKQGRVYIAPKGKAFQQAVSALAAGQPKFTGKVWVYVEIYPPDHRKRDLDNVFKALFDGLTKSGLIADDSLIVKLVAEKKSAVKNGKVLVRMGAWL